MDRYSIDNNESLTTAVNNQYSSLTEVQNTDNENESPLKN